MDAPASDTLRLEPANEVRQWEVGSDWGPVRSFLDIRINGVSLSSYVPDMGVTPEFQRQWFHVVPDVVERFSGRLGDACLSDGRIKVLVCPECGDIGCGALTARLEVTDSQVSWTHWMWEFDRGYAEPEPVPEIPNFYFQRVAYDRVMDDAIERLQALPLLAYPLGVRRLLRPSTWRKPPKTSNS